MKPTKNLYQDCHLFVAAIRVLEHNNTAPPAMEDICRLLHFSGEKGGLICRKLTELEVIDIVEGAYGNRMVIRDHLKLEAIPQTPETDKLSREIEKFHEERSQLTQKVASFKADQEKKQKDLFAEIEKKLKQKLEKKP
ncbi:MAG: hypothetical protein HKM93_23905 [Desulfobacteraceae bacterium]|nr:hypothetical protein [Desulfobacteraceae bacterium]